MAKSHSTDSPKKDIARNTQQAVHRKKIIDSFLIIQTFFLLLLP